MFEKLVNKQYANGSAINMAATLEIDAVIDPAHTRDWLVRGLQTQQALPGSRGLSVDAW